MRIRRAQERDMEGINRLLFQVLTVHHNGRPDLFKENVKNIRIRNWRNCFGTTAALSLWVWMKTSGCWAMPSAFSSGM